MTNTERQLAEALEDYKHACFGYAQDQSEHTARRMTAAKEACLAAAQAAAEPAGEAVPAGHVAWVVSKPGGYKDVGYQSSVLNKLPHGTLLYAKPQHASGSFMTREQAIAHCRERRPGIEPTEQHIAATIDAYAALFGDFAPTAPAAEPLTVPHPGSPEASALIDSELELMGWPANPKNAARAGYEACRKLRGLGIGAGAPARKPLTPDQVWASNEIMGSILGVPLMFDDRMNFVRAVERAHGIGASGGEVRNG